MGTQEAYVEGYLDAQVKALGGETRKVVWQGRRGAPDRLCLFPGGRALFVECKKLGGKTRPSQDREIEALRRLGFAVEVVDTPAKVDEVLRRFLS